jgi:hypothetical protein
MGLYVVVYTSIDERGYEVAAQPIAVRLTRTAARACCLERAERMADNLGGRVLPCDAQCLVELRNGDEYVPEHAFTLHEVNDVPERFHRTEETGC